MTFICTTKECAGSAFTIVGTSSTTKVFSPIYDKFGRTLNMDPNIRTTIYECMGCGVEYHKTTKQYVTTYSVEGGEQFHTEDVTPEYLK